MILVLRNPADRQTDQETNRKKENLLGERNYYNRLF